jgi:hypothetical protein
LRELNSIILILSFALFLREKNSRAAPNLNAYASPPLKRPRESSACETRV